MEEFKLTKTEKGYTLDQDKVISPKKTVKNVLEKIKDIELDLLNKIEFKSNKYGFPFIRCYGDKDYTSKVKKPFTEGKGATKNQAQASGLMELIERYSNFDYNYTHILASKGITKESISPLEVAYTKKKDKKKVFKELEKTEIPWTTGYNLTKEGEVLVPIIYRFYERTNGMAAGNTLEEAIIQAICEIIERDVSAEICENRISTPTIDRSSINNEIAEKLIKKFEKRGVEVILKDFSLGFEIPTVGVITIDSSLKYPITLTSGTHTDPNKALIRALTENVQVSSASSKGTDINKKRKKEVPERCVVPLTGLNLTDFEFLVDEKGNVNMKEVPNCSDPDIKKEINQCIELLKEKSYDIVVVNTTNKKLQIPSVQVFLPKSNPIYKYELGEFYNWLSFNYLERGEYIRAIGAISKSIKLKGPIKFLSEKFYSLLPN